MTQNKVLDWLQKGAKTLKTGLEKGVEKTREASRFVNRKIDESPRASAAREVIRQFAKAQSERLGDVRIHGMRVGDIPHVLQKLSERQFVKMILRIRQVDPDFNWDAFMPDPAEMPIFSAFETLGLPYGTPFEEVKKKYRLLMREYHPDKHSESEESERMATEKTQKITAAYELICEHYGK